MAVGEAGTSENQPDRFLDDILDDEESANSPPSETTEDKNARCDHNRKWAYRRRHLSEALPIRNLNEALDQVANQVHTNPGQCLMSITTIARQAQEHRAGEVIARLAEDTYFMGVNNRVTLTGNHEATSRSRTPVDGGPNRVCDEHQPTHNRSRASAGGPSHGSHSGGGGGGGSSGGTSSHGGGSDRGGRGHTNVHTTG
jgi:uncharacterized membrane protein YgcG